MMNIRPSSEIRNNYPELSKFCKETKQPVYLTVNGKGDTALISIDALNELYEQIELYEKIAAGLNDIKSGNTLSHEEVFAKFRG